MMLMVMVMILTVMVTWFRRTAVRSLPSGFRHSANSTSDICMINEKDMRTRMNERIMLSSKVILLLFLLLLIIIMVPISGLWVSSTPPSPPHHHGLRPLVLASWLQRGRTSARHPGSPSIRLSQIQDFASGSTRIGVLFIFLPNCWQDLLMEVLLHLPMPPHLLPMLHHQNFQVNFRL